MCLKLVPVAKTWQDGAILPFRSTSFSTEVSSLPSSARQIMVASSARNRSSSPSTKAIVISCPGSSVIESSILGTFQHRTLSNLSEAMLRVLEPGKTLAEQPAKAVGGHSYLKSTLQAAQSVGGSHVSPPGSDSLLGSCWRTHLRADRLVPSPASHFKRTKGFRLWRASSNKDRSCTDRPANLLTWLALMMTGFSGFEDGIWNSTGVASSSC